MTTVMYLGMAIVLFLLFQRVASKALTDAYINVAQAAVDASKCLVVFEQLSKFSLETEPDSDTVVFDLADISTSREPTEWWFAVWHWDFVGRQIVMEHSMQFTYIIDTPEYA